MTDLSTRLTAISTAVNHAGLGDIVRGLEKESLRVTPDGHLATTPHPLSLGSALTHPHITTDYSEALLEFITSPSGQIQEPLEQLKALHQFTYQHIGDETLWINSMPCMLANDGDIPLAQYGASNSGRMKTIYREGLGHRYGRAMQTIAGIHFNFSVSDELWAFLHQQENSKQSLTQYKTDGYFRLIRNFRRYFWLLLYLFGAAPAVCRSFVKQREHQLVPVGNDQHSLYTPYATSLRMGDLGYQSAAQESLVITYNCLGSYAQTLCRAITQTHPAYRDIGVRDEQGHYQQLNDSLLQIENEFYSVIRPKRTTRSGQTALDALINGGVEYIEVRCLDLNPFEPLGISEQQIRFLDTFLLYCLLQDSPLSDEHEYRQLQINQRRMVYQGRDPQLQLYHRGKEVPARAWGHDIIDGMGAIARLLDSAGNDYQQALEAERQKLTNDQLTPSARIIEALQRESVTFYRWAMNRAQDNRNAFLSDPLTPADENKYREMANQSLQRQQQIETEDNIDFDQFLQRYYHQYDYCAKCTQPKEKAVIENP